jgi:hypothetical protein
MALDGVHVDGQHLAASAMSCVASAIDYISRMSYVRKRMAYVSAMTYVSKHDAFLSCDALRLRDALRLCK